LAKPKRQQDRGQKKAPSGKARRDFSIPSQPAEKGKSQKNWVVSELGYSLFSSASELKH
jgi:hypothetical protein